jgi:hypothetical protein
MSGPVLKFGPVGAFTRRDGNHWLPLDLRRRPEILSKCLRALGAFTVALTR